MRSRPQAAPQGGRSQSRTSPQAERCGAQGGCHPPGERGGWSGLPGVGLIYRNTVSLAGVLAVEIVRTRRRALTSPPWI